MKVPCTSGYGQKYFCPKAVDLLTADDKSFGLFRILKHRRISWFNEFQEVLQLIPQCVCGVFHFPFKSVQKLFMLSNSEYILPVINCS